MKNSNSCKFPGNAFYIRDEYQEWKYEIEELIFTTILFIQLKNYAKPNKVLNC